MEQFINAAWENRELLKESDYQKVIREVISQLDQGLIRVANLSEEQWIVNEWIKKAILLYFSIQSNQKIVSPPFEYFDKIPLKSGFDKLGVRVVPPATARFGSYLAPQVILMPSYVNIGAYVDSGTMVDTWATVGSCAQIGKNVHLSGGVGIGGVLEPLQATPVIIEDDCFIGSRCIVVEGVHVKKGAVLGANVVLTKSTKVIDVTGKEPVVYSGCIPENSVVIPGTRVKTFPAGDYHVNCALVIGKRNASTDKKTSLNQVLREFEIQL